MKVIDGLSGNHTAMINFYDNTTGEGTPKGSCTYKGGASVSHPLGNPAQEAKSLKYTLQSCTNGLTGYVEAESVEVIVNNGESYLPKTEVIVFFDFYVEFE